MVTPVRIQRRREKGWRMPENTVYVGRPSRWGNRFHVWRGRDREAAVNLFRAEVRNWPHDSLTRWLAPLRAKSLACWCPLVDEKGDPVPCHADVLLELANQ